jgi:hypothetical protein
MALLTPEEIAERIRPAYGRNIQDMQKGIIVLNEDGSNPSPDPYKVPVQVEDQVETVFARYDPLNTLAIVNGATVKLFVNEQNELEVYGSAAADVAVQLGGNTPPITVQPHASTHADGGSDPLPAAAISSAMLKDNSVSTPKLVDSAVTNAKLAGTVSLEKGGTGANLVAAAAGVLKKLTAGATAFVTGLIGTADIEDGAVTNPKIGGTVGLNKGGTNTDLSGVSYTGFYRLSGGGTSVGRLTVDVSAPTGANNASQGYTVGSIWVHVDGSNRTVYFYAGEASGIADWQPLTDAIVDWANPGAIGSGTPNTGEFSKLTVGTPDAEDGTIRIGTLTRQLVMRDGIIEARGASGLPRQQFYRSGNTIDSPTAISSTLGGLEWYPYDGSAFVMSARLYAQATELHTPTNKGTALELYTTREGTAAQARSLLIDHDGTLANLVRGLSQVVSGAFYVQNAQSVVTNTAVQTSLANGVGATGSRTPPGNWWKQNTITRTKVRGSIRGDTTANQLVLRAKLNAADAAFIIISGINFGGSDVPYELECEMLCTAIGAGGNIRTQLRLIVNGQTVRVSTIVNTPTDITIAQTIDITADWANATVNERITGDMFTCERLN